MVIEKVLTVKDVLKQNPCLNCQTCLRLRLLEFGIIAGQKVKIKKFSKELWKLTILDESGNSTFSLGVRKEEAERILFEKDCLIEFDSQ